MRGESSVYPRTLQHLRSVVHNDRGRVVTFYHFRRIERDRLRKRRAFHRVENACHFTGIPVHHDGDLCFARGDGTWPSSIPNGCETSGGGGTSAIGRAGAWIIEVFHASCEGGEL